jgi:hypothetical protein
MFGRCQKSVRENKPDGRLMEQTQNEIKRPANLKIKPN